MLRGKRYKVVLVSNLGTKKYPLWGIVSDPNDTHKSICFHVSLTEITRLEFLIHEMLHACFWDISEEGIEETSLHIAQALWRMGYRLEIDEPFLKSNHPNYFVIRGKRYLVQKQSGMTKGKNVSVCHDSKVVNVRSSLKNDKELSAIMAGLLSVCYPDMDEDSILQTSKDITKVLNKIGYKK